MLGCGVERKLVGGDDVVEGCGAELGNEFLVGDGVGDNVANHGGLACARLGAGEAGGGCNGSMEAKQKEEEEEEVVVGWWWRHHQLT